MRGGSGGAAADQPDGRGDEQDRQREQPAALDPLEWPEPAAGLVAHPERVAVLGKVAHRVRERLRRVRPDLSGDGVVGLEDLADRRLDERLYGPCLVRKLADVDAGQVRVDLLRVASLASVMQLVPAHDVSAYDGIPRLPAG